jgi:phosphonate transport system permease protein
MSKGLRAAFLADRAGIEARHGALLRPNARSRAGTLAIVGFGLVFYLVGLVMLDISPLRILGSFNRLFDIFALMWPPLPGGWAKVQLYVNALGQTLAIAFLGTLLAAILAIPVGFIAARNVVANRIVHLLARRSLDTVRSIDTLIWALIWINVVGLGPFAGALAIMSSDFGAFGILPQVLPVFASQTLYFFESNTRAATIIGIVGAGGIGLWLSEAIRVLEWRDAAFIIILVLITVAVIDFVSQKLRAAIVGRRG